MELKKYITTLTDNYAKEMTADLMEMWDNLFLNLNGNYFKIAVSRIITVNEFFPRINEMLNVYDAVKREAREKQRETDRQMYKALARGQAQCHLCDNTGWCEYWDNTVIGRYKVIYRCDCAHGRDINKGFTRAMCEKEYIPDPRPGHTQEQREAIKGGENPFYRKTVKEALNADDYAVYDALKKAAWLESKGVIDAAGNAKAGVNAVEIVRKLTEQRTVLA